jgi:DNA invertase Pin-like site-specific DNA recombinase
MRAAIYARVSTFDQEPENQLQELRRYVEARSWQAIEFVDRGVSGAKDRRPALDELVRDAKRRKFDVLVCWRLERLYEAIRGDRKHRAVGDASLRVTWVRGARIGRAHTLRDALLVRSLREGRFSSGNETHERACAVDR